MPVIIPSSGAASSGIVVQEADGSPTGTATVLSFTNGQVTSVSGGTANISIPSGAQPISSGTANPGSPATNDLFFRTDLGHIIYYDGTRWLTTTEFVAHTSAQDALVPFSVSSQPIYMGMVNGALNCYITTWYVTTNVLTTNDGTKYWTVTLEGKDGVDLASFNTSADTASTATSHTQTINALLGTTFANDAWIQINLAKTSTPGNIYVIGQVRYRLVIT